MVELFFGHLEASCVIRVCLSEVLPERYDTSDQVEMGTAVILMLSRLLQAILTFNCSELEFGRDGFRVLGLYLVILLFGVHGFSVFS